MVSLHLLVDSLFQSLSKLLLVFPNLLPSVSFLLSLYLLKFTNFLFFGPNFILSPLLWLNLKLLSQLLDLTSPLLFSFLLYFFLFPYSFLIYYPFLFYLLFFFSIPPLDCLVNLDWLGFQMHLYACHLSPGLIVSSSTCIQQNLLWNVPCIGFSIPLGNSCGLDQYFYIIQSSHFFLAKLNKQKKCYFPVNASYH